MAWVRLSDWAKEKGLPVAPVLRLASDGLVEQRHQGGWLVARAEDVDRAWADHGDEMLAAFAGQFGP